jgi:hypothetical protein
MPVLLLLIVILVPCFQARSSLLGMDKQPPPPPQKPLPPPKAPAQQPPQQDESDLEVDEEKATVTFRKGRPANEKVMREDSI